MEVFNWDNCRYGYPGFQDIMILNHPGNTDLFYILHKTIMYNGPGELDSITLKVKDWKLFSFLQILPTNVFWTDTFIVQARCFIHYLSNYWILCFKVQKFIKDNKLLTGTDIDQYCITWLSGKLYCLKIRQKSPSISKEYVKEGRCYLPS